MKRLIVCSTMYQLYNSINLQCSDYKDTDILLFDRIPNAKRIVCRLRDIGIFSRVEIYIMNPNIGKSIINVYKKILIEFIYPQKIIRKYIDVGDLDINYYDVLIAGNVSKFVSCIMSLNKRCSLYLMEDGIASFDGYILRSNGGYLYHLLSRLFKYGSYCGRIEGIYAYDLNLYSYKYKKIIKLNRPTKEVVDIVSYVFDCDEKSYNSKFIWLYQDYEGYDSAKLVNNKIFEELIKYKDNTIIRLRKSDDSDLYKAFQLDDINDMWEVGVSNSNMNKICCIGVFSTALFTPKILFNKEPYLIYLYYLLDCVIEGRNFSDMDKMVVQLREQYQCPNKVFVPKSIQEFSEILSELNLII